MPAVHRAPSLLLAMLSAFVAPYALAGIGEGTAKGGGAADTMSTPAQAGDTARAAVAAVLVATLAERFKDPMLELKLVSATLEADAAVGQVMQGVGLLRLGGGDEHDWLAFRYRSRYDTTFDTAGYPDITLGGDGEGEGERFVPNDARLLAELEAQVASGFEALPRAGGVFLQFDEISSLSSGSRFLQIKARGIADFGPGGSAAIAIEAIYDLRAANWLEISHALDPPVAARADRPLAGY